MEWLFGRKMTPDEMLRKNQRALNKAMRELDREKAKMEQQEKKITIRFSTKKEKVPLEFTAQEKKKITIRISSKKEEITLEFAA